MQDIVDRLHSVVIHDEAGLALIRDNLECRTHGKHKGLLLMAPIFGLKKWDRLVHGGSLRWIRDIASLEIKKRRTDQAVQDFR